MRLRDWSNIGRPIEMDVPTNRAIAAVSMLVFLVGAGVKLATGWTVGASLMWGVVAGAAAFFSWAIARELDPDRDYAAFLGAAGAVGAAWVLPKPSFIALFWILLIARVLNRTTGLKASWLDGIVIVALTVWLSWQWSWIFGMVGAVALLLDARLSDPQPRHRWFAAVCLGAAGIAYIGDPSLRTTLSMSRELLWAVFGSTFAFLAVLFSASRIDATGDDAGAPLHPGRVHVAQRVTLLAGFFIVLRHGDAGIAALGPMWTAVFGVGLYRVMTFWRPSRAV